MIFPGGLVFYILLFVAVAAVVVYFQRLLELRRAHIDCQDFLKGVINVLDRGSVDEALSICEDTDAPVANIVAAAIRSRRSSARVLREVVDAQGRSEVSRLDRRIYTLSMIAQIAPLLGLLGTISGFVKAVLAVNAQTLAVRSDLVSIALSSLSCAAMGIAIAVPAIVMSCSLRNRLDRIVSNLELSATQIIGYFAEKGERQ